MRLRVYAFGRMEIIEQNYRTFRAGQRTWWYNSRYEIWRRRYEYGTVPRLSWNDRASKGERGLGRGSTIELGQTKQRCDDISVRRSVGFVRRRRWVCLCIQRRLPNMIFIIIIIIINRTIKEISRKWTYRIVSWRLWRSFVGKLWTRLVSARTSPRNVFRRSASRIVVFKKKSRLTKWGTAVFFESELFSNRNLPGWINIEKTMFNLG